jgi:hypothetical protein
MKTWVNVKLGHTGKLCSKALRLGVCWIIFIVDTNCDHSLHVSTAVGHMHLCYKLRIIKALCAAAISYMTYVMVKLRIFVKCLCPRNKHLIALIM